MNFVIHRMVDQDSLLKRPRVSSRLSEYVIDFIDQNILVPNRILQNDKFTYAIALSFSYGIPKDHKILYKSPYSTDTRLYVPIPGFRIFENATKNIHLTVIADDIDQNISPKDYAILVYRMFADYLLFNFKKLKKEEFDSFENKLDFSLIEGFPFPADYDDQQYLEENKNIAQQMYVRHYGK